MPSDPMSAMQAGSAAVHEFFLSWVEAGFTRPEALEITIRVLLHGTPGQAGHKLPD
jgi:hypothetical protein